MRRQQIRERARRVEPYISVVDCEDHFAGRDVACAGAERQRTNIWPRSCLETSEAAGIAGVAY
jgi:hypothetical protein